MQFGAARRSNWNHWQAHRFSDQASRRHRSLYRSGIALNKHCLENLRERTIQLARFVPIACQTGVREVADFAWQKI